MHWSGLSLGQKYIEMIWAGLQTETHSLHGCTDASGQPLSFGQVQASFYATFGAITIVVKHAHINCPVSARSQYIHAEIGFHSHSEHFGWIWRSLVLNFRPWCRMYSSPNSVTCTGFINRQFNTDKWWSYPSFCFLSLATKSYPCFCSWMFKIIN